MAIERLIWDSEFFGMEVGKLCLTAAEDPVKLKYSLVNSSFDVVYLMFDQPEGEQISQLESLAPLYDRKVTFRKKIVPSATPRTHDVILYEKPVNDRLLQLTLMSGEYSRFYLDPKFRPYFEKLYTEWIRKSLSGEIADAVYVTPSNDGLAGFITLSKKQSTGQIGLIAVHPDVRGQGVASSLMHCADDWYVQKGCDEAIVITQRDNWPACRLYEKSGYRLFSETAIFHWWRK